MEEIASIFVSYTRSNQTFKLHFGVPTNHGDMYVVERDDGEYLTHPEKIPTDKDVYMELDFEVTHSVFDYIISELAPSLQLNTPQNINIWYEMANIDYDIESVLNVYHAKKKWHNARTQSSTGSNVVCVSDEECCDDCHSSTSL